MGQLLALQALEATSFLTLSLSALLSAGGADMRVGLVHNHMAYAAKDPSAFSIRWVQPVIDWLDRVWGTAETVRYFQTGRFCWRTPPLCGGPVEAADAPPGLDWVGLNYYGRRAPELTVSRVACHACLHQPCHGQDDIGYGSQQGSAICQSQEGLQRMP